MLLLFAAILIGARFLPALSFAYFIACGVLVMGLGIAVLVSAFRTSLVQGLLTLFIPFYGLYYVYGISKNRHFMTLTPLCLVLFLGVFGLPREGGFEIASNDSTSLETSMPDRFGLQRVASQTGGDRSERVVAGYPVAIIPRANSTSFSKLSGPTQIRLRVAGKNLIIQSETPLRIETWEAGDQSVIIANDELIVNYRGYGGLTPGSEILVDHGSVFVSGKPAVEKPGRVKISEAH